MTYCAYFINVKYAHLLYNAFWLVNHFCVHQMLMRDRMHTIDLGVIITLIKAIMRKIYECGNYPG